MTEYVSSAAAMALATAFNNSGVPTTIMDFGPSPTQVFLIIGTQLGSELISDGVSVAVEQYYGLREPAERYWADHLNVWSPWRTLNKLAGCLGAIGCVFMANRGF